jgi:hypothetical protein
VDCHTRIEFPLEIAQTLIIRTLVSSSVPVDSTIDATLPCKRKLEEEEEEEEEPEAEVTKKKCRRLSDSITRCDN